MKINVNTAWLKEIHPLLLPAEAEALKKEFRWDWEHTEGQSQIEIDDWSVQSLQALYAFLDQRATDRNRSARMAANRVKQWMELRSDPDGQILTRLDTVVGALKQYVSKAPHRYLFEQQEDGNFVPFFVKEARYIEARDNSPACVDVRLSFVGIKSSYRNSDKDKGIIGDSFTIMSRDLKGRTVSQVLEAKGYFRETEARMLSYIAEVERYSGFCNKLGFQMTVSGKAKQERGWYSASYRTVGDGGRPAKMVIDPSDGTHTTTASHAPFWDKTEDVLWDIPVHPVFEMFDLDAHADYLVHVNNTEPYVYNDQVDAKLVLPHDIKDFLAILIEHSKNAFEDIIGGKEGGTIVLIGGVPGIGKTLTAEVYSEKMHRPLYKVQSSQLGLSVDKIEANLKEVLQRAERWGAILLIDEADVYIRARGTDILQNAIVGVFLRVLEYYRGVLFMTTNLDTTTDDAIISRTTARFQYKAPTVAEQKQLWRVMLEQNKIVMSDADIESIVNDYDNLTGRDIKNVLKLALVAALHTKLPVTPATIASVVRFKQSA